MVNEISDFASLEHLFLSGDRSGIVGVNRRIDQISDIAMDLINKKIYEAADSLSDVSEDLEGDDFLNPEMVREALSCIIEDSEEVELLTKVLLIHENDINIEEIKDVLSKVKQMSDGLASYWILSSIFEMAIDSFYDANNVGIELLNLLCDEFGERLHLDVEDALQVLKIYVQNNDEIRAMRILDIISTITDTNRRIDEISHIAMNSIGKRIYEAAESFSDASEDLEEDNFLNPEMLREALSCVIDSSEEIELLTRVLLIHENDINIEEIKDVLSKVKQMPDGLASYWILSSIFEMVLDSSYDANNAEIELLNLLCDEFGERIHFGVEEALQVLRIYIANNDDARAMRILHIISDTATESVSEKKAL